MIGAPHRHALQVWAGVELGAWIRHLVRNRFDVHPSCVPLALSTTATSLLSTVAGGICDAVYGARVERTALVGDPLFVIGHWRCGTTFLFNLLTRDPQFTWPTTLQCFTPSHFLLTEKWLRPLNRFYARARESDGMPEGFDAPKEDEFALCILGCGSPYNTQLFPNRGPADVEYLDFDGVPKLAREKWKRAFMRFARSLTLRRPGPLLFKSPTHAARIPLLLEMFPRARFVHIVRNPYEVFPSIERVWKLVWGVLQVPDFKGLDEYVYQHFERIYAALEKGRKLVAPERFYELRYEDLAQDPIGHLQRMYEHLGLDGFSRARPQAEAFVARLGPYHEKSYQLAPETLETINRRWGPVITRYGYPLRTP